MKITIGLVGAWILAGMVQAQTYCVPVTTNYCCNYGIGSVTLPNLTHTSGNAAEGYQDVTNLAANATEGAPLNVAIQTEGAEPHDIRIWLDINNDGTFAHPAEQVFEALNAVDPSGTLALPVGTPTNTPMRLRIMADFVGSDPLPCQNPTRGQAEDYTFQLSSAGAAPVADFVALATHTCNGVVNFTQLATGTATQYLWDFGDGQTSTLANPSHAYQTDGTYSVSLTAGNSQGNDTETKTDYIHVAITQTCDTFAIPAQGSVSILYSYRFVLTDNGYNGPYTNQTGGLISLSPVGAEKVCLHFSEFHFEEAFDYLEIYDGPTNAAPLLGRYSGTELPPATCSTGPALCLKQFSDDVVTYSGFVAQATTQMAVAEQTMPTVSVYPNPFHTQFQVNLPENLGGGFTLQLRNMAGQTVLRQTYGENPHAPISVTASEIPSGLYLLFLQSRYGTWQQKLLKIK